MLKKLFDASEADEFGKKLAEMFAAKYPIVEDDTVAANMSKRTRVFSKLSIEIQQFMQTHKLNLYKKAKLGNAFKWSLMEKGYKAEFVDELTKQVILALK
jgi:hypothetical protein